MVLNIKKNSYDNSTGAQFSFERFYPGNYSLMQVQSSQAVLQQGIEGIKMGARCPHGAPGGACPVCTGKTGGGGIRQDELNKKGMTWFEAYYAWSRIQIAKQNAIDSIEQTNSIFQKARERFIALMNALGFTQKLMDAHALLQRQVRVLARNLNNLKTGLARRFTAAVNTLKTLIASPKQALGQLIGAAGKLAAILGEEIRNIREQIRLNAEKILQTLLNLEALSRLVKVFNDKKQEFHELLARKIRAINEKLAKFASLPGLIIKKDKKGKKGKR